MDFLLWLETTFLGTWVRESPSLWAYPTVLFCHSVGLAALVGINTAVDLRVLGFARHIPLKPLARMFPVMWMGFGVKPCIGHFAISGQRIDLIDYSRFLREDAIRHGRRGDTMADG